MDKRVEWVDCAKGMAIILVVIGHVVSSYHESGLYLNSSIMEEKTLD